MSLSSRGPHYQRIDEVERLDYYDPGGYHPIKIGDSLQNHYQIVHKLGHAQQASTKEIDVLGGISAAAAGRNSVGSNVVISLLDHFNVEGPNGTHPCSVTVPARCSLADAAEAAGFNPFPLAVARSLCAQLAMAVAYTHRAGYVHGDLHYGNLLLQFPALDHLSVQQLYDEFDPPDPEHVVRVDKQPLSPGVPTHVYPPVWLGKPADEVQLDEAKLLLADFGTAFCPAQESRFESYTPLQIRPPEARFEPTKPLSFASDIWSLGCVIWAILGVRPFLDNWLFGPDEITADQMDALGSMPEEWWETWDKRNKYFTGNGRPVEGREIWTFDRRFEDAIQAPRRRKEGEVMSEEERGALFDMVKGVLKFRPGDRPSADKVLQTEWMRKWAIPEAERTWGRKLI